MKRLQSLQNAIYLKNSLYRSIFMLGGGTALAQLIGICVLPIVTRLYTPLEIGSVSIFMSFFGFWVVSIALRYEQALLIATDNTESHIIYRLAIVFVILMSMVGMLILWILQQNNLFELQILPVWTPVVAFAIFLGYGLFMVNKAWALRAGLVSKISQASITRAGAIAGTKLGLGVLGWGIIGLLLAELVGAISSTYKLATATNKHFEQSKPQTIKLAQFKKTASKYKKFMLLDTPSAWMDALAMLLPLPMVASLYGAEAAGWFGMARMVLSLPNAQIGVAVSNAFQMELARALRENEPQRARTIFYILLKKLGLIGVIPLILSIFILPWIFPIIFGDSWKTAGQIIPFIAPWVYAAFIVSPLSILLATLQVQEWKLLYDIVAFGLLVGTYYWATQITLTLEEFCMLMTASQFIAYFVYALLLYYQVESRLTEKLD